MADLSSVQGSLYVVDFNCTPLEIISSYVYFKITYIIKCIVISLAHSRSGAVVQR